MAQHFNKTVKVITLQALELEFGVIGTNIKYLVGAVVCL